jgi:predicted ester cyclase
VSERNKAIVRTIREQALSLGNTDLLEGLYATNYTYHGGAAFGEMTGPEVFKSIVAGYRQVIEGLSERVVDQVAEGNKVFSRLQGSGRVVGEMLGLRGAGQEVTWTAMSVVAFNDAGEIEEEWVEADTYGLIQQITATPAPA